jgi:hypothetical protein
MRKADEGSLSAICTHSPYPQFLMRLTVFVGNPNSALWLRLPKIGEEEKAGDFQPLAVISPFEDEQDQRYADSETNNGG